MPLSKPLSLTLFVLGCVALPVSGPLAALAQSPGKFVVTGNTTTSRLSHTATLLKDGGVLITGSLNHNILDSSTKLACAESYDPSKGTFTRTGDVSSSRQYHAAALLPDGRVLTLHLFTTKLR